MQLTGSVPVLGCNNIEETLNFYQQALQFIIVNQRKSEQGLEWIYLKSSDTLLMLENCTADEEAGGSRIYFYTDDAAGLHHFLKAKGYEPGELTTTSYDTQEFDLSDPEGHRLTIGQQTKANNQ